METTKNEVNVFMTMKISFLMMNTEIVLFDLVNKVIRYSVSTSIYYHIILVVPCTQQKARKINKTPMH